jgi:hypothetical protein
VLFVILISKYSISRQRIRKKYKKIALKAIEKCKKYYKKLKFSFRQLMREIGNYFRFRIVNRIDPDEAVPFELNYIPEFGSN